MNDYRERFPRWRRETGGDRRGWGLLLACVSFGTGVYHVRRVDRRSRQERCGVTGGEMAVAEATYLYALAGLSVSFVGFSTLVIVFLLALHRVTLPGLPKGP
jgi:hypothetical protein